MKSKLLASAPTKENLEILINKFYLSKNYIITEDNKLYNSKFNEDRNKKINDGVRVRFYRNRWRFEMITDK